MKQAPQILLLLLLASLGLALGMWTGGVWSPLPTPQPPHTLLKQGDLLPPLQLVDLQGNTVVLPQHYPNRPLLINLWASWCAPCIKEMPLLEQFANSQNNSGIQVIGIAIDTPENIQAFLQKVPVSYPILLNTNTTADINTLLNNPKGLLPYSLWISNDGRILKQKLGVLSTDDLNTYPPIFSPQRQ